MRGKSWCPYCANQKLCDNENCVTCYNKSVASLEIVKYWRDEENPRLVFKKSNKTYKYLCSCGHIWATIPNNILNPPTCVFCTHKKLCEDHNCDLCFMNSFASHERSKYWSKDNFVNPRMEFKFSHNKFTFDCYCGHKFTTSLLGISNSGSWCPYCSDPPKKLCEDVNCEHCFEKSFASHEKGKYWSVKNVETPRYVFKSANKKYLFICPDCNMEYENTLNHITGGRWCACQSNKTEEKLYKFLIETYGSIIKRQKNFDWCKNDNNRYLPFDFYLEQYKNIIELDGRQHFQQVSNWVSPEITQATDIHKMKCAAENGITVIRILQEDILYERTDWKKTLMKAIKLYESPSRILIGSLYDKFPQYSS